MSQRNYFEIGSLVIPKTVGGVWHTVHTHTLPDFHWLRIKGDPNSTPTFDGFGAAIRGKYLGGWKSIVIINVLLPKDDGPRMQPSLFFSDCLGKHVRACQLDALPERFAVLLGRDDIFFAIEAPLVGSEEVFRSGPRLELIRKIPRHEIVGLDIPLF